MKAEELLENRKIITKLVNKDGKLCGVYLLFHKPTKRYFIGYSTNLYNGSRVIKYKLYANKSLMKELGVNVCNRKNFLKQLETYYVIIDDVEEAIKLKQEILDKHINTGLLFNLSTDAVYGHTVNHCMHVVEKMIKFEIQEVSIDGVKYKNQAYAARALGVKSQVINRRANSKNWPNYIYC